MGVLEFISDVLSVITISLCFIQKIPQIVNLIKLKSAVGINLYALLLELTRYMTMIHEVYPVCEYRIICVHVCTKIL
jgi:hypothetical protein